MICKSCGKESTGTFCGHCGQPLTTSSQWPGWSQGSSRVSAGSGTPYPHPAAQQSPPPPPKRSNKPFTVVAAVLGLVAVGAGSWLGVTELAKSKHEPDSSPSLSVSNSPVASATSSATSSNAPSASSAPNETSAAAPSASASAPSTDAAEQQAASTLSSQAALDLQSVDLSKDKYVPVLATKWVGLAKEDGSGTYTSQDIKKVFDDDKSRFSNVKILKSNKVGKQSGDAAAHPNAYVIFVDEEKSSFDEAKDWCSSNVSSRQNDCMPLHLVTAHT